MAITPRCVIDCDCNLSLQDLLLIAIFVSMNAIEYICLIIGITSPLLIGMSLILERYLKIFFKENSDIKKEFNRLENQVKSLQSKISEMGTNKVVNIIFEKAIDGGYSCYMRESVPYFTLFGYGDSEKEAKEDLLQSYEEIKEMLKDEGKEVPKLQFVFHFTQN